MTATPTEIAHAWRNWYPHAASPSHSVAMLIEDRHLDAEEALPAPVLRDLADALTGTAVTNGGRSVSEGRVYWDPSHKVCCVDHRAMLCVSEDRHIWRCPTCNVGAYLEATP